jgi:hypothetical protein
MFVRVVKRKLRYDMALDFKLLESYRPAPSQPSKHRFLKNWTIRQGCLAWDKDDFLDDVEYDLDYIGLPSSKQKKALSAVKKALCRYLKATS